MAFFPAGINPIKYHSDSSSVTVASGGYETKTFDISSLGATRILSVAYSDTQGGAICGDIREISTTAIKIGFYNSYNSSLTATITINVLYEK